MIVARGNGVPQVLLASGERNALRPLVAELGLRGIDVIVAGTGAEALEEARRRVFAVAVVDILLSGIPGLALLERLRLESPTTAIVLLSSTPTFENAVAALRAGAADLLTKPLDLDEALARLDRLLGGRLPPLADSTPTLSQLVAESEPMRALVRAAREAARTELGVLVWGEPGVGRETLARAIHADSPRAGQPFVALDCRAVPRELADGALFGLGRTADLEPTKLGAFDRAGAGTLWLEGLDALPRSIQTKLAVVIDTREFIRAGALAPTRVRARIMAALDDTRPRAGTDEGLGADLRFRLAQLELRVPPLRERRPDIRRLSQWFLGRRHASATLPRLTESALEVLERHRWPGNVRELRRVLDRASRAQQGRTIGPEALALQGLDEPC